MSNYIHPDGYIIGPGDIKKVEEGWVENNPLPDGYHQLFRDEKPDAILVFADDATEGDDPIKVTEYVCGEPSYNAAASRWEQLWVPVVIDPWVPIVLPESLREGD